jgi:SAM-dependent methyltransferase
MMKSMVPWYARIAGKLVLSRLPVNYGAWRFLGLFSHGEMDEPKYAFDSYMHHWRQSGMADRQSGFVGLEMGPGDSLLSSVLAKACGASRYYLVDVGVFASTDVDRCRQVAAYAAQRGLAAPDLANAENVDDVLDRCSASYMTEGLTSYQSIPDASVDFVWSQAVLEHVRRGEFNDLMRELRRILKPDGVATHQVDLKDHLGGALNNMRLTTGFWEKDWVASSGFYTNRIRFREMCAIFEQVGFQVQVLKSNRWEKVPIARRSLATEFSHLTDDDLLTSDFFVVLRPV